MQKQNNSVSEIEISYKPVYIESIIKNIRTSADVFAIARDFFDPHLLTIQEQCVVLFMNRSNRVFGGYKLSTGGINGTVVDTRIILGIALKSLSTGIIIAHSHPSGNLQPSKIDIDLTHNLREAAKLMDIKLIDHLIISTEGYYSFADNAEL